MYTKIVDLLGDEAKSLLEHKCDTLDTRRFALPGPDHLDENMGGSDRNNRVLRNLQWIHDTGRLGGSGYLSILPIDQGIEHSGGASFSKNPDYFDPENIVKLAIEAGCNGVTSTLGALGMVSRRYAHKIPFVLKINHNQMLTYPNMADQIMYAQIDQAIDMGAVAVGATIYFGSPECNRQIMEVSEAFAYAHSQGLFTILWCYLRNPGFKKDGVDYHSAADLTGQANHLGVTIQADIIKQKLPENNGGYPAINFGKSDKLMYGDLITENPIDMVRWQVANCYMGRVGLINSGGASGDNDIQEAVRTAVINKRGGGMGLILGRKAFQKPLKEGIEIINSVQDVYLSKEITIA